MNKNKISFSDLGISKKSEVLTKTFKYQHKDIIVKQHLTMNEQFELIAFVLNNSYDGENNFSNPLREEIFWRLGLTRFYTNIEIPEFAEDYEYIEIYEALLDNKFWSILYSFLPTAETNSLSNSFEKTKDAYYTYRNSIYGILETVKQDYAGLSVESAEIVKNLQDPENLALLKSIMTKLG